MNKTIRLSLDYHALSLSSIKPNRVTGLLPSYWRVACRSLRQEVQSNCSSFLEVRDHFLCPKGAESATRRPVFCVDAWSSLEVPHHGR